MKESRFCKKGLTACLLLALAAGLPAGMISAPVYAQPVGLGSLGGSNIGQQVSSDLGSGKSIAEITSNITGAGATGGLNPAQIGQMLTNLQSGGASPAAIAGIVNGLAGGSLPPQIATALSLTQNLGNITNPSQLASVISNPAMQQALGSLGDIGKAAGAIGSALGLAQGGQMSPQAVAQAAQAIASVLPPEVAAAVGGVAGIAAAIAGGGAAAPGGATGAAGGGQEPVSNQNPINSSYQDAGCNCETCNTQIPLHYGEVRSHTKSEFQKHRNWIVNTFWLENMLPALQLMASQLTAVGIMQVQMIGSMLDAKHQLETQRVFQQMTAQAHKDYQPSEGMCTFGTTVRSLAASERRSNISQVAFAQRMMQRQAISGDVVSVEGVDSDKRSRLKLFLDNYCDQADNANGLKNLCRQPVPAARRNIDVDYTRNVESRLTLDLDFITQAAATPDEKDVFSLSANLFSNNVPPVLVPETFASPDKRIRLGAVERYMDLRSIFAKRSVAQNSLAAIISQRASGNPESAPYTKAILKELGVSDPTEIEKMLGKNPSYFAQMEILTKKIYQNPIFYTELYDKPVNIERKGAAMQAIGLMQDRDLYNSLLRSEVVLSVLLETMLQKEQDKVANEGPKRNPSGGAR